MGVRGPMPKRSEERTRRNKEGEDGIALRKGEALSFYWRDPSSDWDEATTNFYMSLRAGGMNAYYQQSDVEYAWLVCDEFNRYRSGSGRSAVMFASLVASLSGLGITEGERRRIHIELDVPVEDNVRDAGVIAIEEWRQKLGKAG